MKKILLVSDCSEYQICGVQRKQNELKKHIEKKNMKCLLINPDIFFTIRAPYWKDVKLVLPTPLSYIKFKNIINDFDPDNICFMTEGTLGLMGILHCIMTGREFSTMRCTRLEEYFNYSISKNFISKYIDLFHKYSRCCITPSIKLSKINNHKNSVGILNGCDTKKFSAEGPKDIEILKNKKPLWLYVGRITEEKNIKEILKISKLLDGTFIFVGDGPLKKLLIGNNIITLGWKQGKDLEKIYRSCDIFIFPSKTDTFGQVMVEAMASGLPVAAYNTYGPNEVIKNNITGYISNDLHTSCLKTLKLLENKDTIDNCIKHAKTFSWDKMTTEFLENQVLCKYKYNIYNYLFIISIPLLLINCHFIRKTMF